MYGMERLGRTVRSDKLEKRHCGRSVTPPSSREVSPARSTAFLHKARTPVTHKAVTQPTHTATEALTHKPKTPPPPVASCLSVKRFDTAENGQNVSLDWPSPLCKAVQRGAVPLAVLRKVRDESHFS
jgi:hypothetical protein